MRVAFFKQDSGYQAGLHPWLVEEDGRKMRYHQYPGSSPPAAVLPDEKEGGQSEQEGPELSSILPTP